MYTNTLLLTIDCSLFLCASCWHSPLSCLDVFISRAAGEFSRTFFVSLRMCCFVVLSCDATCCLKAEIFWPAIWCPTAHQHAEPRLTSHQHPQTTGLGTRLHSAPCLLECASGGGRQKIRKQHSDPVVAPSMGLMTMRPLHSSPRLSELMQRSPLPTILGSPSRVSQLCVCVYVCACSLCETQNRNRLPSSLNNPLVHLSSDHPSIWIPKASQLSEPRDLPDAAGFGHRLPLQQDCPSRAQRPGTASTYTGHPAWPLHPQTEWWYQGLRKVRLFLLLLFLFMFAVHPEGIVCLQIQDRPVQKQTVLELEMCVLPS